MSASGIIGTFLGVRSPGTAYVLLHHYMAKSTAHPRLGLPGRHWRNLKCDRDAPAKRVEIRTKSGISQIIVKNARPRASCCPMATRFTPT